MGAGDAARERIRFYVLDLPLRQTRRPFTAARFFTLGRREPARDELDTHGTATVRSADNRQLFVAVLEPTQEPQNIVLRRYRLADGSFRSGKSHREEESLRDVIFRSMEPDRQGGGMVLFVQPRNSGDLLRVGFDRDLELVSVRELKDVSREGDSFRNCPQWLLDQVGDPFVRK